MGPSHPGTIVTLLHPLRALDRAVDELGSLHISSAVLGFTPGPGNGQSAWMPFQVLNDDDD